MLKPVSTALLITSLIVAATATATADPDKPTGFWCWTLEDGETARCAPEQRSCEAMLEGVNRGLRAFGEPTTNATCTWQPTAWELRIKDPGPTGHPVFPTKKLCKRGLERGESCRRVTKPSRP